MNKRSPRESTQPIDPDKVAEQPGLLPYAHHVGSAIVRPLDAGRTRGLAMSAMFEQTGKQLEQIRNQVELLIRQAQAVHERIAISESIYEAAVGFKPVIGQTYYLYRRASGEETLSLVAPDEWGARSPMAYRATVRLLSDHTWEVLESVQPEDDDISEA